MIDQTTFGPENDKKHLIFIQPQFFGNNICNDDLSMAEKISNYEKFVHTPGWELEFGDFSHIPLKDSVSLKSTCQLN